MIQARTRSLRPKFPVGTSVRAKNHIMDPTYPELPLAGWAGEVAQVQRGTATIYLVRWSGETLERIHPVYQNSCERDDVSLDYTWLLETEIELDRGEPLSIACPVDISCQA